MKCDLVSIAALAATFTSVAAHTIITYPGWRGDNLISNESFPYGMQWAYPCGGMQLTTNRTKWPVNGGGAIAVQPGWAGGHATAIFYINMGFVPSVQSGLNRSYIQNASHPMVPAFQVTGPSKDPYPSSFCLPQVPLPANMTFKVGDEATIQVVETAIHGAALYNCVDIVFADPADVPEVNDTNCFNDSAMGFNAVFTTTSMNSASRISLSLLPVVVAMAWAAIL